MKLTCDEATTICDKSQYGEASLWDKIKLNIHIFLCKNCGTYSKQNVVMTKCFNKHKEVIKKEERCLGDEEKKTMEQEVLEKL
ncbi:hypothetical protein [Lutibacter citreus]|uniref:hypothetical protein n=1 Tax=Lutibacter citreus TaxID=2138210 RepID=UPI000DBE561C|nr:hypothetical protein [Lutibacter citreus]